MVGIVSFRHLEYYDSVRPVSNKGNWFLIILGNLNYPTPALKLVLKNYEYLNRRTRDVRFFMPGFIVDQQGIQGRLRSRFQDSFTFFEDGFLDTNDWLENGTQKWEYSESMLKKSFTFNVQGFFETIDWLENGAEKYEYSESMELILLPFSRDKNNSIVFDFDDLLCYNLDKMHQEGKNIIKCIINAVQVIYQDLSVEETIRQMEDNQNKQPFQDIHKVFIAGSKNLMIERDSIRAIFAQLSNLSSVLYRTYTFEDFDRSFTMNGRQDDYNTFIKEEADTALFILNDRIGGITHHEFDIALDSYIKTQRPQIYVYCKKTDDELMFPDIQEIKNVINNNGQYYIEYSDIQDLRNQIFKDFAKKTFPL